MLTIASIHNSSLDITVDRPEEGEPDFGLAFLVVIDCCGISLSAKMKPPTTENFGNYLLRIEKEATEMMIYTVVQEQGFLKSTKQYHSH